MDDYAFEMSLHTMTGVITMAWLEIPDSGSAVVGLSHGRVPEWKAVKYDALNLVDTAVGCIENGRNCTVERDIRPIGRTGPSKAYHRMPRAQVPPFQHPALTRGQPWAVSPPNADARYCQLGCAHYYANWTLRGCNDQCDLAYFYKMDPGYSDRAQVARYECRDGCGIGHLRCQSGFYCTKGEMLRCAEGSYRDVDYHHTTSCDACPHGRYRETVGGRSIDACKKCSTGRYHDGVGAVSKDACLACPPGRFANEEGMQRCKCMNSFNGTFTYALNGTVLYKACLPEMEQDALRLELASIDYSPRITYP